MKRIVSVFDRLTFTRIITIWLVMVLCFSIAFFALSSANQPLIYNGEPLSNDASGFGNAVYFSFITATTIGYGDINPTGFAKVLAIIEALASMVLFGALIARFVAVKQEELIEQVEQLSLEEASNNTIMELYLLRNDLGHKKNLMDDIRHALSHISNLQPIHHADRQRALMRLSLTANSINYSLSRLVELLERSSKSKTVWKKESTTAAYAECQKTVKALYAQYDAIRSDDEVSKNAEEKLEDLNKTLTALQKSVQLP